MRSFPYKTALGWTYDSGDFERCLDRALELLGRGARARAGARGGAGVDGGAGAEERRAPVVVGLAAAGVERRDVLVGRGRGAVRRALRRAVRARDRAARRDGYVVSVGSTPTGQGHHTLFAQIAADRLGVDARAGDGADRGHRRDRRRRRLVRQPHDGDGRLGGGRGGRRPARRAGRATARFESEQVFASGAYMAVVEVDARDGRRCACGG